MKAAQLKESFNRITKLGGLVAYYPPNTSGKWLWLTASVLFLLMAFAVIGIGAYTAYEQVLRYGWAVLGKFLQKPGFIALFILIVDILCACRVLASPRVAAALYEKGFACLDRSGIQTWQWTSLVGVQASVTGHYLLGIPIHTRHIYGLFSQDGLHLRLDDSLSKVEDLVRIISQATFSNRVALAEAGLKQGRTLMFGTLFLKTGGIKLGKKVFRWNDIQRITLHQGRLKIHSTGKGGGTVVSKIINLDVLLVILNRKVLVKI